MMGIYKSRVAIFEEGEELSSSVALMGACFRSNDLVGLPFLDFEEDMFDRSRSSCFIIAELSSTRYFLDRRSIGFAGSKICLTFLDDAFWKCRVSPCSIAVGLSSLMRFIGRCSEEFVVRVNGFTFREGMSSPRPHLSRLIEADFEDVRCRSEGGVMEGG